MRPENRARFLSSAEITRDSQLAWTERARNDPTDLTCVAVQGGRPVGMVALYDIAGGSAEYGRIVIDETSRRQRVGLAISGCIVAFGFGALELDLIYANCLSQNRPILDLLGLLGFRRAGTWHHEQSGLDVERLEIGRPAWSDSPASRVFDRLYPSVIQAGASGSNPATSTQ